MKGGVMQRSQNEIPKLPILMYHEVTETPERNKRIRNTNPAYCLSVRQFSEQMEHLKKNGYQVRLLNVLIDPEAPLHKKSLIITFDDGWKNNYTNAFPILKKHGLTATIFVVTGFVGKERYLDWHQLKEMNEQGISIQSHTVSHRPLNVLEDCEIMSELERSRKMIEDRLGSAVDFLSVPQGMINQNVIEVARSAGYRAVCTSEPGYAHISGVPAILKRINIPDHCSISAFENIIRANRMTVLSIVLSKKMKNLIKTLIGYNNYRKLYRFRYRIGE
jgi:peptidoglycan/xylan/chitin deacetylase (PgdA/CDA1 family)